MTKTAANQSAKVSVLEPARHPHARAEVRRVRRKRTRYSLSGKKAWWTRSPKELTAEPIAGLRRRMITLKAKQDLLQRVGTTRDPIKAIAEFVWNALDADASDVKVDLVRNALGGIEAIRISDDGSQPSPHREPRPWDAIRQGDGCTLAFDRRAKLVVN